MRFSLRQFSHNLSLVASLSKALGKRVSIRVREPDGGARDLLGLLIDENTVKRKDGSLVSFDPEKIIAFREVQPVALAAGRGAPLSHRIRDLELSLSASWPPIELFDSGAWRYRFSDSQSLRANSVLPLGSGAFGDPGDELERELANVEKFYRERSARAAIQISQQLHMELDLLLEKRKWTATSLIDVMVADLKDFITDNETSSETSSRRKINDKYQLEITQEPSQRWLDLQGSGDVQASMARAEADYLSITALDSVDSANGKDVVSEEKAGNELLAVGRIGYSDGWAVFSRIFVSEKNRRLGLGDQILRAMLEQASKKSMKKSALQVGSDNQIAKSLYEKYGFRIHHSYLYRMAPDNLAREGAC